MLCKVFCIFNKEWNFYEPLYVLSDQLFNVVIYYYIRTSSCKWLTRKSLSDELFTAKTPKAWFTAVWKATPTRLPEAQPQDRAGGTCHRNLGVSAEYTSYLPSLPIPVHDFTTGAAPGQEGKLDLVGASKWGSPGVFLDQDLLQGQ